MIHARIDTVDHRKIVGFEVGNKAQFDANHGGDPLWVFVDSYSVNYRANRRDFFTSPLTYKVTDKGYLVKSFEPPIEVIPEEPNPPPGYEALRGTDGRYLKGADGNFIYGPSAGYTPPPAGQVYLYEDNGVFLTDDDNWYLTEDIDALGGGGDGGDLGGPPTGLG